MSEPVLNKVWLHDCRHEIWSIQCLAIHDRRRSPIRQNTLNCVKQESVYFVQFVINWVSLMVARSSVFPREELRCIIGLCQRHFCCCLDTRQPINSVDQSEKRLLCVGNLVSVAWRYFGYYYSFLERRFVHHITSQHVDKFPNGWS